MPDTPAPSPQDRFLAPDYWAASRQPLASLVFIAPLLVTYEVGVLTLGPNAVRNGADVWLRALLELLDFGQYFLLPLLVIGILLGWHHTTHAPWRVPRRVFPGMIAECALLALCLRVISDLEAFGLRAVAGSGAAPVAATASSAAGRLAGFIGFLGAGVYEELLFRLILLSSVLWAIRRSGVAPHAAAIAAVLGTSAIFAAAHYVGPYGEPILLGEFAFWHALVFRFLAGVMFSVLFVLRGFGIAAGTHAGYDILAKLL